MGYCTFESSGGVQTCVVCGASFATEGKIRSVCGIKREFEKPKGGVGTELKKLLKKIGINATPNCKCNSRAVALDYHGIDYCIENIETIIEWLKEEATARGLPFFAMPARILVRRAIANARKESRRAKEPDQ